MIGPGPGAVTGRLDGIPGRCECEQMAVLVMLGSDGVRRYDAWLGWCGRHLPFLYYEGKSYCSAWRPVLPVRRGTASAPSG